MKPLFYLSQILSFDRSIKAAWDQTKKLETTLLTKTNVKSSDVCTYTNANDNNHKLGVALMRTSKIIYCFGLLKGKQFTREEFIDPVSEIIQARSEIMEDADVCVLDGDYKDVDCFTDISDLNDFNIMYEAVVEQIRLLEGLYIGTHKDD